MEELRSVGNRVAADVVPSTFVWREPLATTWGPEYAGFWRRSLAGFIDGILLRILTDILGFIGDRFMERVVEVMELYWFIWLIAIAVYVVPYILVDWLYHALQESSAHQATVGKRALGIVVTDLKGDRISFGRATGRYFARYLSLLTLGIGYLIQPFTAKRQTLHDIIAKTLVVRR